MMELVQNLLQSLLKSKTRIKKNSDDNIIKRDDFKVRTSVICRFSQNQTKELNTLT